MWSLDRPDSLVFDELYYVRDAVSQLVHGYPTVWPDNDPAFGGERARAFGDQASTIAHPPLGKWLIGAGVLLFGPDSGWGWRIAVAIAGVLTVALTMVLATRITGERMAAWCAGLLLALDGVHVVLTRVALLDGFLTLFIVLGALCIAEDWRRTSRRAMVPVLDRPWLFAAGLAFGAAAAVKWSGLYAFAAFLLLLMLGDLVRGGSTRGESVCVDESRGDAVGDDAVGRVATRSGAAGRRAAVGTHALVRFGRSTASMLLAVFAALVAYVATWLGWILAPGGQYRSSAEPWWVSLWRWHADTFEWHATLNAPHPFQSSPLGWPLAWRPTAMYSEAAGDLVATISPIPNPLVTWAGVVSLLVLLAVVVRAAWRSARRRRLAPLRHPLVWASAFVLAGYLSGWLPWVLTLSRPAVFQFYSVVMTPFAAISLAMVLASLLSLRGDGRASLLRAAGVRLDSNSGTVLGRRLAVAIFLAAAFVLALLFWPLWAGVQVDAWFYRSHLWLPGW